ncbi:MAG: transporter ATP-binding protein, partial [Microvirga sp.]|nr:transporter ATP-binding protein [Microvirga sp.]
MTASSTTTPALQTRGLTLRFCGHVAVNDVSCRFTPGTLTAIVGPNGAGKTTYFNLISGQLRASSGQVIVDGEDITGLAPSARTKRGLGRAFQLTNLFPQLSALENVRLAVQSRADAGWSLLKVWNTRRDLIEQAEAVLERVRLADKRHIAPKALSHGDQRKLEVALLIAMEPKVFMFDEPTAGMSVDEVPTVLELINDIRQRGDATVLLVEHKMDVVRSLSDRIIVLHNGALVA